MQKGQGKNGVSCQLLDECHQTAGYAREWVFGLLKVWYSGTHSVSFTLRHSTLILSFKGVKSSSCRCGLNWSVQAYCSSRSGPVRTTDCAERATPQRSTVENLTILSFRKGLQKFLPSELKLRMSLQLLLTFSKSFAAIFTQWSQSYQSATLPLCGCGSILHLILLTFHLCPLPLVAVCVGSVYNPAGMSSLSVEDTFSWNRNHKFIFFHQRGQAWPERSQLEATQKSACSFCGQTGAIVIVQKMHFFQGLEIYSAHRSHCCRGSRRSVGNKSTIESVQ